MEGRRRTDFARPPWRLRKKAAIAASAIAVLVVLVGAAWLLLPRVAGREDAREDTNVFCPLQDGDASFCSRRVPGAGARPRPTGADDPQLVRTGWQVARLASNAGWCTAPSDYSCFDRRTSRPPTEVDVRDASTALTAAGFTDHVVRLAGSADPAPGGSLLYAVRVGDACIVGYTEQVPRATYGSAHEIVGLLPDGRCLG